MYSLEDDNTYLSSKLKEMEGAPDEAQATIKGLEAHLGWEV